ncbi:zinc finger MYND domain-containing protein 10 [Panulirus ornatus]|uniref:zinc finger MYND domain-containing protein 10 n=1 Tax=Panulirus ornatus TaxID=150431 RepID=UPI003A876BFE
MADGGTNVLQTFEIDHYIDELECISLEDTLSSRWVVSGCRVVQLSVQAALEASHGGHEHVQHSITLHNKGLAVVWQLMTSEAWRLHLLPSLLDAERATPTSSLPFVMVLQTEAAALGLLESLAFHEESAVALEGLVLDLIDYCVRQLTRLATHAHTHPDRPLYDPGQASHTLTGAGVGRSEGAATSQQEPDGVANEVRREERRVGMVLGCRAVSVIQLLASCRERLPLCATTRLMHTHDVPQLLASLLYLAPWRTEQQVGEEQLVFEDGVWAGQRGALSRSECQAWATLHTLLMDRETLAMYEVSSGRRAALLKLRGRLNDAALAQMPALEPLARWLAALALTAPQQARPPPLVTTVAQLEGRVAGVWEGRWGQLADVLAPRFLAPTTDFLRTLATNMAAAWDLEALEALLPDTPTCATCGSPAGRRCSRCRIHWYCRRECQVKHWPDHKKLCDLVASHPTSKKSFIQ